MRIASNRPAATNPSLMFMGSLFSLGLGVAGASALITWLISLSRRDVSIVDSLWPLMFVFMAGTYWVGAGASTGRPVLALGLTVVWALRLCIYITWRNHGHGEDRRYQAIRARNEPNFAVKSLYLVFLLQAVLAWVISSPVLGAMSATGTLGLLDAAGTLLWGVGMVFEAGGDWQLARFKADPANQGRVMDQGFWRWTRHPNYFGDFCVWWGLGLIGLGAGAWWGLIGPLLMSLLLLRVSGVVLLEKDIAERRPDYASYARRTNAFFPGFRRN